ncbi:MAG: amidase [Acidimicrobiales bacterium]
MTTFITRLDATGPGPRVAVKDIIDVEGVPTTAGSKALERIAKPAVADAACLAGSRAAGARVVGKANLHELAMLPLGTNPWFGTPVNPLDATLIPGGSSSGSAVAVATDEADVAFGSDTGGSVRIPSACCGTTGLKTSYGRISTAGVWPLAPSLDTIGPMARDVAGTVLGMQLLEPGFAPSAPAATVGRLRTTGLPEIEGAIDAALRASGLEVVSLAWDAWDVGTNLFMAVFFAEMWEVDHELIESDPEEVGPDIHQAFGLVDLFRPGAEEARRAVAEWRKSLVDLFDRVEVLALPTIPIFPPTIESLANDPMPVIIEITRYASLLNVAGLPCIAKPVPVAGSRLPTSLQLVGPPNGEELLTATAAVMEAAVA